MVRWAKALKHFAEHVPVTIFPDELCVVEGVQAVNLGVPILDRELKELEEISRPIEKGRTR